LLDGLVDEHPLAADGRCAPSGSLAEQARSFRRVDRVEHDHPRAHGESGNRGSIFVQPDARRVDQDLRLETSQCFETPRLIRAQFFDQRLCSLDGSIQHVDLAAALAQSVHQRARGATGPEDDRRASVDRAATLERAECPDPVGVRADPAVAIQSDRVDRADRAADGLQLVDVVQHRLLVGNRDGELANPLVTKLLERLRQASRGDVIGAIGRFETEGAIGGPMHRG
jgi:hypothetical protein